MNRITPIFLFCILAGGCAGGGVPHLEIDDKERYYLNYAGPPVDRVTEMGGVRSWHPISDDRLVIKVGFDKSYLVRVWTCPGLRRSRNIGVITRMGGLSKHDKVLVDDQTCPIREIRRLDVGRMKADQEAAKEQQQKT